MNKKIYVLLLTLIFTFSLFTTAFAAPNLNFRLVNKTGFDIDEVYVSPASTTDWEEDIMGIEVLMSGDYVDITFAPKTKTKVWDLRVVDTGGNDAIWYNFDLSVISEITISMKNGREVATWR